MNCLGENVCHIETCGFAFGKAAEHLRTAGKAIVIHDYPMVKIKMDNRGASPVWERNSYGGFVVGTGDEAKSTGRIGGYYPFTVKNGCICIDLREEIKR